MLGAALAAAVVGLTARWLWRIEHALDEISTDDEWSTP